MPVRSPPASGPASSTPRALSSSATIRPPASSVRRATSRASAPSQRAHAATFAGLPARDERDRRGDVVVARVRPLEPDDDVEQQISERDHAHAAILADSTRGLRGRLEQAATVPWW